MPRGAALVVRFSSLGDVLLAAHLPSFLRMADPGRRVLFVTKERYADILRGHPDLARVYRLAGRGPDAPNLGVPAPFGVSGSLGDLRAALRREGIEEAYDLHQNYRTRLLLGAIRKARRVRSPKHALRRRLMVFAKWLRPEPLPWLLDTYRSLAGLPSGTPARPWLRDALSDAERARALARLGADVERTAFLGVGARWETKRWPLDRFVALGDRLLREAGLSPRFLIGPTESTLADELRRLLPPERHGEIVQASFRDAAALGSFARVIVSNDSASLHLGPALGVPAIGIFGSTVPAFGFAPRGPRDRVVEIALGCRPCGVHGRDRCPLGHHRCMQDIGPEMVMGAVRDVLAHAEAAT
jgi:lipopolysaccharide heptosyltransferase II